MEDSRPTKRIAVPFAITVPCISTRGIFNYEARKDHEERKNGLMYVLLCDPRYAVSAQTGRLTPVTDGFACGSMVLFVSF